MTKQNAFYNLIDPEFKPGAMSVVAGCDFKCRQMSDGSLIFCERGTDNALTEEEFRAFVATQKALKRRYNTLAPKSIADYWQRETR